MRLQKFLLTLFVQVHQLTAHTQPLKTQINIYGIQFHPEVRHSVYGNDILRNFALNICEAKGDWTMDNFIDMQIQKIRETVGDKRVLLGLSGGVDSSVVGVLLKKAIGDQLICIFVDHGLLRKGSRPSYGHAWW